MDPAFLRFADALHPAYKQLIEMVPVTPLTVTARNIPAIYLLSEENRHLYVGRTRRLRNRMRQHSYCGAGHNQAVFAFRLAREVTGMTKAAYSKAGSRIALVKHEVFGPEFVRAKARVGAMDLRYVEVSDPVEQTLLEVYVSVVLGTPYNDFDTH